MTGMDPLLLEAAKSLAGLVLKTAWDMGNKPIDGHLKQLIFRASQQYVQNYTKRHGTLKVICVRMDAPIRLDEIFTPVQLLERSDLRYFESPDTLHELFRGAGRGFELRGGARKDGIFVANKYQYLMVLGGPGVGKSTFLRKVGLESLKGRSEIFQHHCIPVFLRLQTFNSNQKTIVQLIEEEFETCGFPEARRFTETALQEGKLLVLLDGLDEVPMEGLDDAITQIENLVDRYRKNRFITSCRTAAYKSGFRNFNDVVMAVFNDNQIEQFIYNWFRAEPQTAKECWELLKRPEYVAAKELAQTPLLLTLLCGVYDESQNFPQNRSAVYGEALDVLLKKWAAEKRLKRDPIYRELSPELEQILLAEIACTSFTTDQLFFSKQDVTHRIRKFLVNTLDAPKYLDAEAVLNAIEVQQGILVERARDTYSFSHLTLQEYLTAQYIKEHQQLQALVTSYLVDRRWREVFLLVAGLMRGGADEFLLMMERKAQLFIDSPRLRALLFWADEVTNGSLSSYHPAAKRAVAIFFARARVFDRDRALTFDRTLALDHAYTLALALDPALDHAHALDLARALDLDRALTLDHVLNLNLVKELIRLQIFKFVTSDVLLTRLKVLRKKVPSNNHPLQVRQAFVAEVQQTWFKSLNMPLDGFQLSQAEWQKLENYFYATELIVRCKEQAVRVSPQVWSEIVNRMVLPSIASFSA